MFDHKSYATFLNLVECYLIVFKKSCAYVFSMFNIEATLINRMSL